MLRNKRLVRTFICFFVVSTMVAVLPSAAQEADWLVSTERGTVGISSPAEGDRIVGVVEISGTAISPGFAYYKVEFSVDGDTWFPVDGDAYMHVSAVTEGDLTTWDTTAFKDGAYWLRAVVVDNTGNYVASDPIKVTIDNPRDEVAALVESEEEEVTKEAALDEEAVAEGVVTEEATAPSWFVSTERGTVGISSPAEGDRISGLVEISGTAISPGFAYYKVEFSVDGDTWFPVDGDAYMHVSAVTEGDLTTWDATAFKNGTYWLRAVVVDNTGNYVASDPIKVTIDNPRDED